MLSLTKIALAGVVVFGRVASVGQRAFQLLDNVAHMRFKGSWEQFKNDVVADADALDATVTAKLYKVELALAGAGRPKAEKDKKDKTRGQGTDQAAIEKARKATLALAEAEQDALARVAAAELKDQEAAEKERYEKGLESLHDYYANRIAMAEQQGKVEAAALYAKIVELQNTPLGKDELPAERQAQVTKAAADFQVKLLENAAAVNQLQGEQAKEAADLQQKALEFEKKIQKAQGDRFAAAKAEIEAQAAALDEILRKQGVGADERAQRVGAFRTSGFQQVDFDKLQNQASVALDAIEQKRRQIELAVQSGQLFSFQGEQQIVGMERERLPLLQQIADAMRAAAITDEQKASAAEFQAKLEQLAVSSNKAAQQMGEFKQNVEGAATSDLSNWLSSGIDQAENLGDAFRGLALSVVQSLRQIASQMLATYMIQKLLGFVMGAAAPASSPVGAGAQMPAGLSGGGIGMATGGLVRGPGTGTSDSIAARLSAGEYVIHAAAVRKIGVEALNALNFGNPTVRRRGGTRFAEGGLVDAGVGAGAGPQGLSATIGLDEGLLLKRLEASPAFHRLFVKVAGQNKKGMSQALR